MKFSICSRTCQKVKQCQVEKDEAEMLFQPSVSKLPHGRVFVYVRGRPLYSNTFLFTVGSVLMKAKFSEDSQAKNSANESMVAAMLPTKGSNSLQEQFFHGLAQQNNGQTFYVRAPPDIQPGERFEVLLFGKRIRITRPMENTAASGSHQKHRRGKQALRQICCFKQSQQKLGPILQFQIGDSPTSEHRPGVNNMVGASGGKPTAAFAYPIENSKDTAVLLVKVPDDATGGAQFPVVVGRHQFLLTCPLRSGPENVKIVHPLLSAVPIQKETKRHTSYQLDWLGDDLNPTGHKLRMRESLSASSLE